MKFKKAKYWHKTSNSLVQCDLCPKACKLAHNKVGFCKVRQNKDGELVTYAYGKTSGISVDPIEKKPLFHFLPKTNTLSLGGIGCNLGCKFCQNWSISHADLGDIPLQEITPRTLIENAKRYNCPSVSFTYNDPVINAEFIEDFSKMAKGENIKTVIVSAGYITPKARKSFFENADAANIDLKSFSELFYKEQTQSTLAPVKETLRYLVHDTDVWTEITTLLIPGLNDSQEEIDQLTRWISEELSPTVPIHFSAFHPAGEINSIERTPRETLDLAFEITKANGLKYVYTGNVMDPEKSTTYCKSCSKELIRREWFEVTINNLKAGRCPQCNEMQDGVWC